MLSFGFKQRQSLAQLKKQTATPNRRDCGSEQNKEAIEWSEALHRLDGIEK